MSSSTYLSTLDSKLSVSIPSSKGTLSITNYCSSSNWGGNPNGFKLGSAYTQSISERTLVNCISFDHASAGFDKNNAKCNVELKNCLSFDNGYNYHLSVQKLKLSVMYLVGIIVSQMICQLPEVVWL